MNYPDSSEPLQPRLMGDVLGSLADAVVVECNHRVVYANAAFERIFGYAAEEICGGRLQDFIVPEARQKECAQVARELAQGGVSTLETERKRKNGALVDVAFDARPLLVGGKIAGLVFTFREIGERKRIEAKLQHDALHDTLTGLPNRALFQDRLGQAFRQRLRRRGQNCGVIFLDLDRFKDVNDTLGHTAGDELLIAVAERLRAALRPQDTAARLGGDEFAILVEHIHSISDMERVAGRVLQAMEREYQIGGRSLRAAVSIGVAIAGAEHAAPELLTRDADFAMYRAKQAGGGRMEIFDKKLEVVAASLQERELELRRVLDQRLFQIWYEPICRLQTESGGVVRLEGFEAQLRWPRADGTVARLSEVMAVAEETGLSISLGREKLELVCRQLHRWSQVLPQRELSIAIRLSQRQFYHPDLIAQLKKTLVASEADAARLLLEVGEETLSEDPVAALGILERLLGLNLRLAVDDFGSSLGPLNHLVRLPIDVLKLDPALTKAATQTGRQVAVLESLIQLGLKLGVEVVAQGIETREQMEALVRMGCALGQGPLLSPVLEPEAALELAERGEWRIDSRA